MGPSSTSSGLLDTISLRALHTSAIIGPDAWARPRKSQPLILSVALTHDTASAGASDNVTDTFSYGQMGKEVVAKVEGGEFSSIEHITQIIAIIAEDWPGTNLKIIAMAPKALLRVKGCFGREVVLSRKRTAEGESQPLLWHLDRHEWFIRGLDLACVIGVNDHERLEKQGVVVDLTLYGADERKAYIEQKRGGAEMWRRMVRVVCEIVEKSTFQTLEALAALLAKTVLQDFPMPKVTVKVEKPSALTFVDGAGVEITRTQKLLPQETE